MYFISLKHICTAVVLILLVLLCHSKPDTSTLKLVQILFRHGERSPLVTYRPDNDPHRHYWSSEPGQLTKYGMRQQYALGKYLRERYQGFIGNAYSATEIYVRSSDMDRTLMSALSNLAGLFHQSEALLDPSLPWQPIPVHTVKLSDDHLLHTLSDCPKYLTALQKMTTSNMLIEASKPFQDLIEQMGVKSAVDAFVIYDTWAQEKQHNLTLPAFAEENWGRMIELGNVGMSIIASTKEQKRLKGGPLLGEMTNNMKQKMLGTDTRKMFAYSGHDATIVALLAAMEVYNDQVPPYAASVILELHQSAEGYIVQLLYKNDSSIPPYVLTVPGCSSMCPFEEFVNLTSSLVPVDINQECMLLDEVQGAPVEGAVSSWLGFLLAVLAGMFGTLAVLCSVVVVMSCLRRRQSPGYGYDEL